MKCEGFVDKKWPDGYTGKIRKYLEIRGEKSFYLNCY